MGRASHRRGQSQSPGQQDQLPGIGIRVGRVTRRIHQPMCYTQPCRCSKTDTKRSSQTTGRVSCGQEKVWVCVEASPVSDGGGSPEERQREEVGTAPNSQEKGPVLFVPLFFLCSLGISAVWPQHGPAEDQLRIENSLVRACQAFCVLCYGGSAFFFHCSGLCLVPDFGSDQHSSNILFILVPLRQGLSV